MARKPVRVQRLSVVELITTEVTGTVGVVRVGSDRVVAFEPFRTDRTHGAVADLPLGSFSRFPGK